MPRPSPSFYKKIAEVLSNHRASPQLVVDMMSTLKNEDPKLDITKFYAHATHGDRQFQLKQELRPFQNPPLVKEI